MATFLNLDPVDVPADGEVLVYDNASKTWLPRLPTEAFGSAFDARYKDLDPIKMLDYAVGDEIANDTAAALFVFDKAITEDRAVYSPPGAKYLVDELTIAGDLRLEGKWTFSARTNDQPHVLKFTETVDWSGASVWVNGKNRALYGVRGADFGRSKFGILDVQRCKIWGKQFDPTGNNNVVTVNNFVARLNGAKSTQTLTETAETANVLTSSAGYGSFTLATPLTLAQVSSNVIYWVVSAGLAYKVKSVTTTTIEVFNLKASTGVGGTVAVDIVIGGGLNIPSYGDNGVGTWGSMDVSSNFGNGVHMAPLYGHNFAQLTLQANTIGFSCSEYTIDHEMKCYFENNDVNYVSWSYVAGIMKAPTMDLSTIQNCINRLAGNGSYDPKLVIIKDNLPGLTSPLVPGLNPGSRTLVPGQSYAYHRSAAATWNFVIDNHAKYDALGAYFIMVDLSHASSNITCPISLTLGTSNGQTIEGVAFGTPYTSAATGKAILKIYRVGADWKVAVTPTRASATSITLAPTYTGQQAVVAGVGYTALGTAAATDWKPSTPLVATSILATPAYAGQTALVSGIAYIAVGASSPADWRTASGAAITSISGTPSFIGQHAMVAGIGYMAVGTASAADWVPVTRPVPTSILGTPAYAGQVASVGGISYIASGVSSPADWKTAGAGAITSIAAAPAFIGQHAIVSGVGYMAIGTASAADWLPVTRPPVPATSIAAAPAYVDQKAIVAGVGYMAVGTSSAADWKQITN